MKKAQHIISFIAGILLGVSCIVSSVKNGWALLGILAVALFLLNLSDVE